MKIQDSKPTDSKKNAQHAKMQRRAQALRENLRKRKHQKRVREVVEILPQTPSREKEDSALEEAKDSQG